MSVSVRPKSDSRRELIGAVVLIVLGGAGVLFGCSRVWLSLSAARPAPFGPLTAEVKGRTEFAALAGLSIVTLLSAALILVTGRWARTGLGLLLMIVALASGWYAVRGLTVPGAARLQELLGGAAKVDRQPISAHTHPFWPVTSVVSAVLSFIGGLAVLLRCSKWSSGLATRYEAPAEAAKSDDPWRLLDRGEDPTIIDR